MAATGAFAQSSVTISGVLDAGYRNVSATGTATDTKGGFQNGTATSAIFIKGTEDLGSGLKAEFQYEINPDFVGGSGFSGNVLQNTSATDLGAAGNTNSVRTSNGANGNNFVGVSSAALGGVKVGRLNTGSLSAWQTGSVFGTALGSGYATNGNMYTVGSSTVSNFNQTAPTRFNGSVEYTTPSFSGFTARALYVPKVDATDGQNNATVATVAGVNRAQVTDLGAFYSNGPLNVALTQQQHKFGATAVNGLVTPGASTNAVNGDYKLTTLAANYAFGPAKLHAAYWTEKQNANAIDAKAYMLGAKYTLGAIDLMASYAKRDDKLVANADRKILGLGADYNLSKRTALWARYESKAPNTNASGTNTTDATKTTAVGIRHSF